MADTQNVIQVIKHKAIEATRAAVWVIVVIRSEKGTETKSESINMGPRLSRPTLKKSTFDWGIIPSATLAIISAIY